MKNEFKYTKTTVSLINYHFVFCPRYRRKIFNIPGVETAFKTMVMDICKENNIDILAMECHIDHVHMFVSVYPQTDIPGIMHLIKGVTSNKLRAFISGTEKDAIAMDEKLFCQHCRECQF